MQRNSKRKNTEQHCPAVKLATGPSNKSIYYHSSQRDNLYNIVHWLFIKQSPIAIYS